MQGIVGVLTRHVLHRKEITESNRWETGRGVKTCGGDEQHSGKKGCRDGKNSSESFIGYGALHRLRSPFRTEADTAVAMVTTRQFTVRKKGPSNILLS